MPEVVKVFDCPKRQINVVPLVELLVKLTTKGGHPMVGDAAIAALGFMFTVTVLITESIQNGDAVINFTE